MIKRTLIAAGNIISVVIILMASYAMATGFYLATMVLHGSSEQAIRLLYVSTVWACAAVLACVVWFGVWFRYFKDKPTVLRASDFHPMQN